MHSSHNANKKDEIKECEYFFLYVIRFIFITQQATSNASEMKRLQAGDIDYKEAKAASAIRNKFEVDGIKAEQNATVLKVGLKSTFRAHTFQSNTLKSILTLKSLGWQNKKEINKKKKYDARLTCKLDFSREFA